MNDRASGVDTILTRHRPTAGVLPSCGTFGTGGPKVRAPREIRLPPGGASPLISAERPESDDALPADRALGLADGGGRVDQPDVTEGLREVPEELPGRGVDLLREQPDLVHRGDRPLERGPGPA